MQKHEHPSREKKAKAKAPPKQAAKTDTPKSPEDQLEGEGSYKAARRYDEEASEFARDPGAVESSAREAERAIDGDEHDELAEAEREGKRGLVDKDIER